MIRCGNCGKEMSAGAGYQTQKYGFICYSCASALNLQVCSICGQRFPFSDMKAYLGEFFCNDDYKGRTAQIASYKPKPQPKGPPISSSTGIRVRRSRITKAKIPYESLTQEIRSINKPIDPMVKETKEPEIKGLNKPKKVISKEEENAKVSDILKELHEETSSSKQSNNKEILQDLKRLRGRDKDKKE